MPRMPMRICRLALPFVTVVALIELRIANPPLRRPTQKESVNVERGDAPPPSYTRRSHEPAGQLPYYRWNKGSASPFWR